MTWLLKFLRSPMGKQLALALLAIAAESMASGSSKKTTRKLKSKSKK